MFIFQLASAGAIVHLLNSPPPPPFVKTKLGIYEKKLTFISLRKKSNPQYKLDAIKEWDSKTKKEKLKILDKRLSHWKIADQIPILRRIQNFAKLRDREMVQQKIKDLQKEREKITKKQKMSKSKKYWK